MIRHIHHDEIDMNRWDECIRRSENGLVYAQSWYLDIISPAWDALIDDDYSSVFPLTHHRKMGISYLRQPFFAQQLGLFSVNRITEHHVTDFLWAIPEQFRYVEIHLNSSNKVNSRLFQCVSRINHELDLSLSREKLKAAFAQNTRRNIRKAEESEINTSRNGDPDVLIWLYKNNFGRKDDKLRSQNYQVLLDLMHTCMDKGIGAVWQAGKKNNDADAMAFFITYRNRHIMLSSATNFKTRENGAMFHLIDTFIAEHAEKPEILDFEGGNDPGVGRFYKGFGSSVSTYYLLRINRLSHTMDSMIRTIKRIRNR